MLGDLSEQDATCDVVTDQQGEGHEQGVAREPRHPVVPVAREQRHAQPHERELEEHEKRRVQRDELIHKWVRLTRDPHL